MSFLSCGYRLDDPDATGKRIYVKRFVPPLDLEYSRVPEKAQLAATNVQELSTESQRNLPSGFDGVESQWVDLDGEGLSGVLTLRPGGWYYKRNTSANNRIDPKKSGYVAARLSDLEEIQEIPSLNSKPHGVQFMDLASYGQL